MESRQSKRMKPTAIAKAKSKLPKFGKKAQFMSWCVQYVKDDVPFSSFYTMAIEKKKIGIFVGLEIISISDKSVSHLAIAAPVTEKSININTILNQLGQSRTDLNIL